MLGFHVPIESGKINIQIIIRRQKYLGKNWKIDILNRIRTNSGSIPDQGQNCKSIGKIKVP